MAWICVVYCICIGTKHHIILIYILAYFPCFHLLAFVCSWCRNIISQVQQDYILGKYQKYFFNGFYYSSSFFSFDGQKNSYLLSKESETLSEIDTRVSFILLQFSYCSIYNIFEIYFWMCCKDFWSWRVVLQNQIIKIIIKLTIILWKGI